MNLPYLNGFGNYLASEALPSALPSNQNSPQKVSYGLYAEQLSGSAFTTPRAANLHSWLYRIQPSVLHSEFTALPASNIASPLILTPPTQMRWDPLPYPAKACDFIESLFLFAKSGAAEMQCGAAIYLYAATRSMQETFFYNADGELLIVPQEGSLFFHTEFGPFTLIPGEIAVIPRGIKFSVSLTEKARGYLCENYGLPFRLPDLGLIGANGLAQPRDFQIPSATFEERTGHFKLIAKFQDQLWQAETRYSPLNVVAWHGNYYPYKYPLACFNTINTVSFDHPDPSIFTVLTSPSYVPAIANVDFVVFPPRWMVAENTFRPPYFHRNIMSEYMGLIKGQYDAKSLGFIPGGSSLHNCMSAHGPDKAAYENAIEAILAPTYYHETLAFMFESKQVWQLTEQAYQATFRQKDYLACWKDLPYRFNSAKNKK